MKKAKKVCLIGRFAVGKTSLVKQFISQQFGEKYKTTVGVSISTKKIQVDEIELSMVIWDIAGFEQEGHYTHYLRGVHGIIWVLDGTEPESFEILDLVLKSMPETKDVPSIYFINKCDLLDEWLVEESAVNDLKKEDHIVLKCSAKTGENVEIGFNKLAQLMVN